MQFYHKSIWTDNTENKIFPLIQSKSTHTNNSEKCVFVTKFSPWYLILLTQLTVTLEKNNDVRLYTAYTKLHALK